MVTWERAGFMSSSFVWTGMNTRSGKLHVLVVWACIAAVVIQGHVLQRQRQCVCFQIRLVFICWAPRLGNCPNGTEKCSNHVAIKHIRGTSSI